ncbi:MAG: hypothetical protein F4W91_23925 [Gemmatimonadetes bacterium]|nr:hypothetical protein [Gemmatimonadota bacterium]
MMIDFPTSDNTKGGGLYRRPFIFFAIVYIIGQIALPLLYLEICMQKRVKRTYLASLILLLFFACGPQPAEIKIATYNIYWLDDGISNARQERLQTVLRELNADIIGFQEIQSKSALERILPDNYTIGMLDDPEELQELAIAVREPFEITDLKMVFPEKVHDQAFPRKRDLLQAYVEGYGHRLIVLVHHAKSRSGGRAKTNARREASATMTMRYLTSRVKYDHIVLLGDFNDNPDDRSLNILESGNPDALAGIDYMPDAFLYNTSESLLDQDYCSYGYHDLYEKIESDIFEPMVPGARAENNKWRGESHNFARDVKVKAILFDQILVSQNLKDHVLSSGIFTHAEAVKGNRSRIRFSDGEIVYTIRGDLASDHVPVWTILKF